MNNKPSFSTNESSHDLTAGESFLDRTSSDSGKPTTLQSGFYRDKKPIPKFKNEAEEAEFWATHDTTQYFDTTKLVELDFPNLKPTTKTITLRLPIGLLNRIRKIANKKDVLYQSLMKVFLDEKAKQESSPISK